MSTFAQDGVGDLLVTQGKCTLVTDSTVALAQKLRNQFKLFLGEWYLDTRVGFPYLAAVLGTNPNTGLLSQIFATVIRNTPGVLRVDNISVTFDRAKRQLAVAFSATDDTGKVITFNDLDQPFLVQIPQAQGLGAGGTL